MAERETFTTRRTRLENIAIVMADSHERLERVVEDTRRQMAEEAVRTDQLFTKLRIEANEREKRVDERIEKLVIAIGELIHRNGKV